MPKRLVRALFVLFVLYAALASAPAQPARGGVFCVDAPMESDCPPGTLLCCNDYGGCWCGR